MSDKYWLNIIATTIIIFVLMLFGSILIYIYYDMVAVLATIFTILAVAVFGTLFVMAMSALD